MWADNFFRLSGQTWICHDADSKTQRILKIMKWVKRIYLYEILLPIYRNKAIYSWIGLSSFLHLHQDCSLGEKERERNLSFRLFTILHCKSYFTHTISTWHAILHIVHNMYVSMFSKYCEYCAEHYIHVNIISILNFIFPLRYSTKWIYYLLSARYSFN